MGDHATSVLILRRSMLVDVVVVQQVKLRTKAMSVSGEGLLTWHRCCFFVILAAAVGRVVMATSAVLSSFHCTADQHKLPEFDYLSVAAAAEAEALVRRGCTTTCSSRRRYCSSRDPATGGQVSMYRTFSYDDYLLPLSTTTR